MTDHSDADILYGVEAISEYLGLPRRAAQYQIDRGRIPTLLPFGDRRICARRSTLSAWLAEREAAAQKASA